MDYEKKYKEALERAKDLHDNHALGKPFIYKTCEDIFPELKESKDERIRKDIIETIKIEAKEFPSSIIASKAELWLAWLEKQCDCKSHSWKPTKEQNVSPLLYGVIDSKKREILLKRLEELYNSLGIDTEFNTPDYLLAEYTLNYLVAYGNVVTKNIEKGYIKTLKF